MLGAIAPSSRFNGGTGSPVAIGEIEGNSVWYEIDIQETVASFSLDYCSVDLICQ